MGIGADIAAKVLMLAKIDNVVSLNQFERILPNTDGVVIARADLGLELAPEKLVLAQKWITQRSIAHAKPVFV